MVRFLVAAALRSHFEVLLLYGLRRWIRFNGLQLEVLCPDTASIEEIGRESFKYGFKKNPDVLFQEASGFLF